MTVALVPPIALPRVEARMRHHRIHTEAGKVVDITTFGNEANDPVVFLHGFGACPAIYRKSLSELARRGHFVIAPALPGFGGSDPLPMSRQNVNGIAEHISSALTQYGLDRAAVVGHSLGGGVALRLAVSYPDMVSGLTLICPVGGARDGGMPVGRMLRGILAGDAGEAWMRNGMQFFLPALVRHPPSVVAAGMAAWFSDQIRDVQAVDRLGIPARLVFADRDYLVKVMDAAAAGCSSVKVEHLQGRHSWLIGEPDRFADLVTAAAQPA